MSDVLNIEVAGQAFRVATPADDDWFWPAVVEGRWEPLTFDTLREHVPPGGLYLDIGAWIGPTVLYAAGLAGRVAAVEPDPAAADALRANLALNPHLYGRVEVLQAALAAEDGPVSLNTARPGNSMTTVLAGRGGLTVAADGMSVRSFLDRVLGGARECFIKIDVEGAEFDMAPPLCAELVRRGVRATLYLGLHGHLFDDVATPGGWARNLERHGRLLAALDDYGRIDVHLDGAWRAFDPASHAGAAFNELHELGGSSMSVLVRPR